MLKSIALCRKAKAFRYSYDGNKDVRLSVPSIAIPYGQRWIKILLAEASELVNLVPRGAGDWTDANIGGSLTYDNMLQNVQLYINNILN